MDAIGVENVEENEKYSIQSLESRMRMKQGCKGNKYPYNLEFLYLIRLNFWSRASCKIWEKFNPIEHAASFSHLGIVNVFLQLTCAKQKPNIFYDSLVSMVRLPKLPKHTKLPKVKFSKLLNNSS